MLRRSIAFSAPGKGSQMANVIECPAYDGSGVLFNSVQFLLVFLLVATRVGGGCRVCDGAAVVTPVASAQLL